MSFFDSIPQPPPPEPPPRPRRHAWMMPEAVIPGSVPAEVILVRAETVAVALSSFRAYPNGFEFTVHVRLRHDDADDRYGLSDPFERHARSRQTATPGDALRLGILYSDGRRTATTSRQPTPPGAAGAAGLYLQHSGSSGSSRWWDSGFWVHPLPPYGPVTFVASWPAYEIDETRAQVDGSAILAAAARAVELWPDDPGHEPASHWTSSTITIGGPGPGDTE